MPPSVLDHAILAKARVGRHDRQNNRPGETMVHRTQIMVTLILLLVGFLPAGLSEANVRRPGVQPDDAGNLASVADGSETLEFDYDNSGRVNTVSQGGTTINYRYGPDERRVGKTVDGTTTRYFTDGLVTYETDGATTEIQRAYVFLPDGYTPIMLVAFDNGTPDKVYFYLNDHLSTPRIVTNETGQGVWRARYAPFGQVIDCEVGGDSNFTAPCPLAQPIRFPGQWDDGVEGVWYNWHRFYLPEYGIYGRVDPVFQVGAQVWDYVGGNPVAGIDPAGLLTDEWAPGGPYGITYGRPGPASSGIRAPQNKLWALDATNAAFDWAFNWFGSLDWVREQLGADGIVNKNSMAYQTVENIGVAADIAIVGKALHGLAKYGFKHLRHLRKGKCSSGPGPVSGLPRGGSAATKKDAYHAFPDVIDNFAGEGGMFKIQTKAPGGAVVGESTLYQVEGSLNHVDGIFEWIVNQGTVTHRRFIKDGVITGIQNQ